MKKRFVAIDFLRAVGILGVIATHVFSYNLTSPLNTFIWNYLHFVITSFVFASGYVMYIAYKDRVDGFSKVLLWYWKRLVRLLQPYYIYLIIHVGLVLLLPVYFGGLGIQKNWHYISQSIILTGGINENWLPLLFVELAVLFPILLFLLKRFKSLFWIYIVLSLGFTLFITISPFPYSLYRWVMWIPWSLVFVLSWFFVKKDEASSSTKTYLGISLLSFVTFTALYMWYGNIHRSLTLIDNKYPPNLFYISYEFGVSFLLLALANLELFQNKILLSAITFLSKYSYALFFIHFLFLDLVVTNWRIYLPSVWLQLGVVITVSITALFIWDKRKRIFYLGNSQK